MAINPYISSANVFVYPCANRKEGFWESKLATEYSLRTLIPWKITKPSFVITGDPAASNLEFVINGYYFNIKSNWRTAINPTSEQPLWAHIRLANKPLTSAAEGETTTILVNYEDGSQILDEGTLPNCTFKGVRFDSSAGTEATNYYHLQILDEDGNFLHRDMIKINCDDPLEQDDETGLLSLKYGNGLTLNNNTLITKLGNGLEFGNGTDGEKPIQIKLATNSGLTRDTNGLKVINAVSDPVAANNILQSLKINNVTYTIPQGKTYTAGNGIQIDSNNIISAKTDSTFGIEAIDTGSKIILADGSYLVGTETKTVYSGLQFAVCTSNGESYKGLQIKLADSSLQTDSNGLAVKLETNSGLGKSSGLYVQLQSSGGLQKNSNGLGIKLPTNSGLTLNSGGLKISQPIPEISDSVIGKFLKVTSSDTIGWTDVTLPSDYKTITNINSTSGGTNLTSLTIGGVAYKIPSGGGGGGTTLVNNNSGGQSYEGMTLYTSKITVSNVDTYSGLQVINKNNIRLLSIKPSVGLAVDENGLFIKLKGSSGLDRSSDGLYIKHTSNVGTIYAVTSITAGIPAETRVGDFRYWQIGPVLYIQPYNLTDDWASTTSSAGTLAIYYRFNISKLFYQATDGQSGGTALSKIEYNYPVDENVQLSFRNYSGVQTSGTGYTNNILAHVEGRSTLSTIAKDWIENQLFTFILKNV